MSRARILADYVSSGDELALKAPIASPTFTGTVAIPNVANLETAVVANTAKVTNATHTGHVTGGTALTIANDAVDSQHYAADSIDTEHYAPASVDTTAMAASVIGVKPHIIPGVLYPAVAGKLLNGATHSGAYGTAQTQSGGDGHKYYYTDIKGSKPIKDPRIGAHFGSQRHKFKSIQLLEQETATHGKKVYSIDGRESIRVADGGTTGIWLIDNSLHGHFLKVDTVATGAILEITGFFNDINFIVDTEANRANAIKLTVNGTQSEAANALVGGVASEPSPLGSRYVDKGSIIYGGATLYASLGTIPTINTLKYEITSGTSKYLRIYGIELIAQDRGSNSGSDLAPNNSATSMGSLTEANATTGWTNNNFNTFASVDISSDSTKPAGVGSYALHVAAGDGSDWGGSSGAITTVVGVRYKATIHYKVVNGDADTNIALYGGTAQGNGNIFAKNTTPDTDWHTDTFEFAATTTAFWFTFQESSGSGNDCSVYFAGVSLFALNNAELSQVQIPSQDVVSYGKKFTVSGNPHYDPFNGFVNDTTLFSSVVDTATSLGLGTATTWGAAWDKGSNNHIRPYNGGRVVKWVDSTGVIKTSVNMMPPNAQNIGTSASNEITTPSATNSHTINFSNDAVDSSLQDIAKTFNWREFGNGAANGGTGAARADASMLAGVDNIAYVMDDGLTSLASTEFEQASAQQTFRPQNAANDEIAYWTFIGTGISVTGTGSMSNTTTHHTTYAQNLPYGTHILKIAWTGANAFVISIDSVALVTTSSGNDNIAQIADITFHQPKRPPIPEDAVVIADYMLMADFVIQGAAGVDKISKGVRRVDSSRDHFYDTTGSLTVEYADANSIVASASGIRFYGSNHADLKYELPAFSTDMVWKGVDIATRYQVYKIDGSTVTPTAKTGTVAGSFYNNTGNATALGLHTHALTGGANNSGTAYTDCTDVVSPIHTSSHYQTFETTFLHELVGGDRNMEQTNLVVTPDGQTWDEVTRDVSYIGNMCINSWTNTSTTWSTTIILDEWRGKGLKNNFNKDFAIAYDRVICLVDGQYQFSVGFRGSLTDNDLAIYINGILIRDINIGTAATATAYAGTFSGTMNAILKRGDYVQIKGMFGYGNGEQWQWFEVERI